MRALLSLVALCGLACTVEEAPVAATPAPLQVTIVSRAAQGFERTIVVRGAAADTELVGTMVTRDATGSTTQPIALPVNVAALGSRVSDDGTSLRPDPRDGALAEAMAVSHLERERDRVAMVLQSQGGMEIEYEAIGEIPHSLPLLFIGLAITAYCSYNVRKLVDRCVDQRKSWEWGATFSARICDGKCID